MGCWHANARVKIAGGDEAATSLKRGELKAVGSLRYADKQILNRLLPHLRVITRLAESVFDAETRGMVRALHQRGRPVLEFDAWGLVRRQHGIFDGSQGPLIVMGARVITAEPTEQSQLEAAIFGATRSPRRPVPLLLNDRAGNRYVFQIIPIVGRARDAGVIERSRHSDRISTPQQLFDPRSRLGDRLVRAVSPRSANCGAGVRGIFHRANFRSAGHRARDGSLPP